MTNPYIKPGDLIAIEIDGLIYTDQVTGISFSSPKPAVYKQLSPWQRIVRRFTLKRRRKSLVIRQAESSAITITIGDDLTEEALSAVERTARASEQAATIIGGLIDVKPANGKPCTQ